MVEGGVDESLSLSLEGQSSLDTLIWMSHMTSFMAIISHNMYKYTFY